MALNDSSILPITLMTVQNRTMIPIPATTPPLALASMFSAKLNSCNVIVSCCEVCSSNLSLSICSNPKPLAIPNSIAKTGTIDKRLYSVSADDRSRQRSSENPRIESRTTFAKRIIKAEAVPCCSGNIQMSSLINLIKLKSFADISFA